ncbi:MAG: FtsK protein, partial [Patescibacteria group bacterium]|nr:FtsK protein [Patescibacteria group bacterium]
MAAREDTRNVQSSTRKKRARDPILTETILGVLAVLMLMLATLLVFSMVHAGGVGGEILFSGLYKLLGVFSYLTPLLCIYIAYYLWKEEMPDLSFTFLFGMFLLILGVA